jgi:uncharacterized protein (TIGR02996 family)
MTDREALLRAVAANPDDDTPRLIYADCLDELGGEANTARARFIRLQIEIQRAPDTGGTEALGQKVTEARSLAAQFGTLWLAELPVWITALPMRSGSNGTLFSRGFVARVLVLPGSYDARWWGFLDTTPITALDVRNCKANQLADILKCSQLARLRNLTFMSHNFGNSLLYTIGRSRHLAGLQELDLAYCQVSDRGLLALARSNALPSLRVIRLASTGVTDEGIAALISSAQLPELWEVDVRLCPRKTAWIARLQARCPDARILH